MAENFSYFSYNNNLERSFLSSLSQILGETTEGSDTDNRQVEEVESQADVGAESIFSAAETTPAPQAQPVTQRLKPPQNPPSKKWVIEEKNSSSNNIMHEKKNSGTATLKGSDYQKVSGDESDESDESDVSDVSDESGESEQQNSDSDQSDSDLSNERIFVQLSNPKQSSKVVPLTSPKKKQRRVQFQYKKEHKAEVSSDDNDQSEDDVKEINIAEVSSEDSNQSEDDVKELSIGDNPENELEALIKQLVLLENEASKAQQFLQFIQQHSCFDKQDHKAVHHLLDMIEQEKKSLVVVLSNYSPQVQPLITMMTIAERRVSLLDSCSFITPGSTLHATFVEKQRSLQDVIDQATSHVYGRK